LMVVPFDLESLKITGPPSRLDEQVSTVPGGHVHFIVSMDGSLIYFFGNRQMQELVWVDR